MCSSDLTTKYLLFFVLGITALAGCSSVISDDEFTEDYDKGPNLIDRKSVV